MRTVILTFDVFSLKDMKPQNIAFDIRGDVRVFDFGLAKELVEADLVQFPDDYNVTGMTGSRRWMSPEVYFNENYGLSSDVYSFGLLLWNLCYLETPYGDHLTLQSHHKNVMVKGKRPKRLRSKIIPDSLWALVSVCWAQDRSNRPTMEIVCEALRQEISTLKVNLELSTRKKTNASNNPAASAALDATAATSGSSMDLSRAKSSKTAPTSSTFTFPSPCSSLRRGNVPVLKLFQRTVNEDFEDPVDVSFHHHGNSSNKNLVKAREQQINGSGSHPKQPSRFLPRGFKFRTSDIEERSLYLSNKSLISLAGLQHSSSQLHSSANSRP